MRRILLTTITLVLGMVYSNAQNVTIPNASFKAYLVGNTAINTNADSEIQTAEAQAFTGIIHIGNYAITDLTGIEAFTSLTELICYQNQLTTLDLSANLALTRLRCHNNLLTALNLGANTVLNEVWCYTNQISSLDVSANTGLTILYCHENDLAALDLSQNTALNQLYCFNNQLSSLDVRLNAALVKLHCNTNQLTTLKVNNGNNVNFTELIAQGNPDLACIQVDNQSYSAANWNGASFIFDFGISFSENCALSANMNTAEQPAALNVFPNPSSTDLTIETVAIIESIEIFDINGSLVQNEKTNNFSVATLMNGVYFIHVKTEKGLYQSKFVKQ